jgi:hypothetical protein
MAKSVSLATRLKIAASLKGNKNAYRGGPKARLSTRDKVANINAMAKRPGLSAEQKSRRAKVAMRLRAQARKEEALGGANRPAHAGVANKTPQMKHDAIRSAGRIPNVKNETVSNAPNKLPPVPQKLEPGMSTKSGPIDEEAFRRAGEKEAAFQREFNRQQRAANKKTRAAMEAKKVSK